MRIIDIFLLSVSLMMCIQIANFMPMIPLNVSRMHQCFFKNAVRLRAQQTIENEVKLLPLAHEFRAPTCGLLRISSSILSKTLKEAITNLFLSITAFLFSRSLCIVPETREPWKCQIPPRRTNRGPTVCFEQLRDLKAQHPKEYFPPNIA